MIRCTAKLLKLVGQPGPEAGGIAAADDDWYANLLWIEGRKCLHATHAATLFSVFVPDVRAADLRPIGKLLTRAVIEQLEANGLPVDVLGPLDGDRAVIGKTASRQILGCMIDQAFAIETMIDTAGGLRAVNLSDIHQRLQRNIVSARNYRTPLDLIAARLSTP